MAATPRAYSNLLSCIYDEPEPVGRIGRGTHYSVFRAAEWRDVMQRPLPAAQVHDFAVIWDEDHDDRIIDAVERIYMKSLLSPIQFIGERKGSLNVILAAKFFFGYDQPVIDAYRSAIQAQVSSIYGDSWSVELGSFDRSEIDHQTDVRYIIQDSEFRAKTYLRNIDALWGLGTRDFVIPKEAPPPFQPTVPLFGNPSA